jgi:hypothetical protein
MKVEPGLVSVRDLLLKANSGDWSLWLPSFQRRFVWVSDDIKAFFDSLYKGNPVGILLLWRSKNPKDSDPFALRPERLSLLTPAGPQPNSCPRRSSWGAEGPGDPDGLHFFGVK